MGYLAEDAKRSKHNAEGGKPCMQAQQTTKGQGN